MIDGSRGSLLSTVLAFALTLAAGGCASPEADRVRAGGAGADPGNRNVPAEMRSRADVYHETPCRLPTDCPDPAPGPAPEPDS